MIKYGIPALLLAVLIIPCRAQYTYFNQLTGEAGDLESQSAANVEVVEDGYVVWGAGIVQDTLFHFIRKYSLDGESYEENTLIFPDEYVLTGIVNSFKWNPIIDRFVYIHGTNMDSTTEGLMIEFNESLDTTYTRRYSQYDPYTYPFIFIQEDDGYVIVGEYGALMNSAGTFIMKLDFEGNLIWDEILQPEVYQHIYRNQTITELEDGYLLAGGGRTDGEPFGLLTITDFDGVSQSEIEVVDEDEIRSYSMEAIKLNNGEILVDQAIAYEEYEGSSNPDWFWTKVRLRKFDPETEEFYWQQDYFEDDDFLLGGVGDMEPTDDGGAILLGGYWGMFYDHYAFLMKIDSEGNEEWFREYTYQTCDQCYNVLYDVEVAPDGGYIMAGKFNHVEDDPRNRTWLLKVDACGNEQWQDCSLVGINDLGAPRKHVTVYPNPTRGRLNLESPAPHAVTSYTLTNMSGQLVKRGASNPQTIDLTSMPAGIYALRLQLSSGKTEMHKVEKVY